MKYSASMFLAVILAGCAIKPDITELPGFSTEQIVKKIRCELRDAIVDRIVFVLSSEKSTSSEKILANKIKADRVIKESYLNFLDEDSRENFKEYQNLGIGYEFSFEISNNNEINTNYGLDKSFIGGLASLSDNFIATRNRKSKRTFVLSDTFQSVLINLEPRECEAVSSGINYLYPINGKIGIEKSLTSFIEVRESSDIKPNDKNSLFIETITFTTILKNVASGGVGFSGANNVWHAKLANIKSTDERSDIHQLTLSFSLPPAAPAKKGGGSAKVASRPAAKAAASQAVENINRLKAFDIIDSAKKLQQQRSGQLY